MNKLPVYHIKQKYLDILKHNKLSEAINALKNIHSLGDLRNIKQSIKVLFPKMDESIEGMLFPKNLSEMSSRPSNFFKPSSVYSEVNWVLAYSNKYWKEISWFVELKKKFEHHLLTGDFYTCHKLVDDVKQKLGVSLWYFESLFILYEYEDDRTASIKLMSNMLENCRDTSKNYIPALFSVLFERSTKNLSPYKFDDDLTSLYKRNKTDLHEDYYKYILFRLNYYNQYSQVDLSLPVMFESLASLVDRYLIVISVLKTAFILNQADSGIASRALYIYDKTNDSELYPILALQDKRMPVKYFNPAFVRLLDDYYCGRYDECMNKCINYLKQDSSIFDVYVIYCRSLTYLKKQYKQPLIGENIPINRICQKVYAIINDSGNSDSLYSLYKITKNLYGFRIAASLDYYLKVEENQTVDYRVKALNTDYFDPIFTKVFAENDKALSYLQSYDDKYGYSSSCNLWKHRILKEVTTDKDLTLNISAPHNAEMYLQKEDYKISFKLWKDVYDTSGACIPLRQNATRKMIECYFRDDSLPKALKLYVDLYIADEPSIAKVDTASIIKYMQEKLYCDIRRTIDLVIFVGMNCENNVDKSFILFEFCEIKGKVKPSELIANLEAEYNKERVEVFFRIMNDNETLRHYFNIGSFQARLEERQNVLNYLISLNTKYKQDYENDLKSVQDALLVYKVVKNIDGSKIYADEQAIFKWKLPEVEGMYKRYLRFFDLLVQQRESVFILNLSDSILFSDNDNYESESESKLSIKNNGIYEVFKSLYDYIADKFLFSEYGLVAYLSTRVRHGELESELRPEMSHRNLILSLKGEEYQDTLYWSDEFNLSSIENRIVNDALKKFSEGFDLVVANLIKYKLQIHGKETMPKGLFNYQVTEEEVISYAIEFGLKSKLDSDPKTCFSKLIINWLWQKTEVSLEAIRNYIATEFTNEIEEHISNLKNEINQLPEGHCKDFILSAITDASSALSTKIKKITSWFFISGVKLEDIDIKKLSYQIFQNIKLSYPQYKTPSQPKFTGLSFKVKANFVIHFADLLRNILTNMFKHGVADENGQLQLEMDFNISVDHLNMNFINDLDEETDETILQNKLRDKLSTEACIFNSEGGSGIAKIKKILRSDLQCPNANFSMYAKDMKCYTEVEISLSNIKA